MICANDIVAIDKCICSLSLVSICFDVVFQFDVAEDGGLCVNDRMETTVEGVFAAGDVCTATWQHAQHWLQVMIRKSIKI